MLAHDLRFLEQNVLVLSFHVWLTLLRLSFAGMSELTLDGLLSTEARSFVEMVSLYISLFWGWLCKFAYSV
jgi:hypothetical protein